jgi:hypothetical protein
MQSRPMRGESHSLYVVRDNPSRCLLNIGLLS